MNQHGKQGLQCRNDEKRNQHLTMDKLESMRAGKLAAKLNASAAAATG